MYKSFWKNKRVFITGVSGFVGSSLAKQLFEWGAEIYGLVKDDNAESVFNSFRSHVTVIHGDLENLTVLERAINENDIQYVFHLGAQAIVGAANQSPLSTFRTNVLGTCNLLEACRGKKSLKAIIIASSDKAYGTHKKLPYREDYPLLPQYPYDTSKACGDLIAQSYVKTYKMPIVITRFANIYGPGDYNFSRIIPDTIRHILEGKNPVIRSDGKPERDYLFIEDVIDLYLTLARNIEETQGQIFNAGHNKPYSVLHIVKTLIKISGNKKIKPEVLGKGSLHGEIDRQWMDGHKVYKLLGWKPKIMLEQGLRKTFHWYQKNLKH